jgi:hypothetical protein
MINIIFQVQKRNGYQGARVLVTMENPKGGQSDVFIKKDPLPRLPKSDLWTGGQTGLGFLYDNSAFFTDLDTAFATQTFFGIDGYGFAILHFKDFNRANIYTFFAASAFFFVDDRIKSHYICLLSN